MAPNETRARRPWFKPKRIGYGVTPQAWQGWVVVGLFVALVGALGILFR
jgi:hypothetical protein